MTMTIPTKLLKIYHSSTWTEIYLDNWSQYRGTIGKESDDLLETIRKSCKETGTNLVTVREYVDFLE